MNATVLGQDFDPTKLCGRRIIRSDVEKVTAGNVVEVLQKALLKHNSNRMETQYLWDYYRGLQPILNKEKTVREEINNKIVENRSMEIVSFKTGYLLGEPLQYVSKDGADGVADDIEMLNDYMYAEEKHTKDKEITDWFHICGTAYRMVLPSPEKNADTPFIIDTLDPRNAFVIYRNDSGEKPLLGVKYVVNDETGVVTYNCYTDTEQFVVQDDKVLRYSGHLLGGIPIIEYPLNMARLGAFETVIPLLDAINKNESNQADNDEQIVQALMIFHNVDISSEGYDEMRQKGAIRIKDIDPQMKGDVKYIISSLENGSSINIQKNLYQAVLTICGVPSMGDGSSSDSSNNGASLVKNGWQAAEVRAKDTEAMFSRSERRTLRIVLNICKAQRGMNLKLSDVRIRFTRRNYENILQKAEVLTMMLGCAKVHPKLAFEHSGLFVDPELAYTMSDEWYEEHKDEFLTDSGNDNGDRKDTDSWQSSGDFDRTGSDNDSGDKAKTPDEGK